MPDAWEQEHGSDAKDPADRNGHHIDSAYSNLESYLNELASRCPEPNAEINKTVSASHGLPQLATVVEMAVPSSNADSVWR